MTHTASTNRPQPDWQAEAIALEKENCRAFVGRDIERLNQLWSDDLLVKSPINRVHDKRRVLELLGSGVIAHLSYETDIEVAKRDGDILTVMGSETVINASHSPPVRRRYTNVWRREGDAWRLFLRHANVILDSQGGR